MSYHPSENIVSPAKHDFIDLMQHGDDFFKIQLLRPAKSWYEKALEFNIETDQVRKKIAECDRLLAFEMKVIKILVAFAAIIVLLVLVF